MLQKVRILVDYMATYLQTDGQTNKKEIHMMMFVFGTVMVVLYNQRLGGNRLFYSLPFALGHLPHLEPSPF